jgi:hypothetical protein
LNTEEKKGRAQREDPMRRTPEEHPALAQEQRDDGWWTPIYVAVVIVTVLVITGLWLFSRAFSS